MLCFVLLSCLFVKYFLFYLTYFRWFRAFCFLIELELVFWIHRCQRYTCTSLAGTWLFCIHTFVDKLFVRNELESNQFFFVRSFFDHLRSKLLFFDRNFLTFRQQFRVSRVFYFVMHHLIPTDVLIFLFCFF